MDLWKVSVSTTSEAADAVSVALADMGLVGCEIEDVQDVRALQRANKPGVWVDEGLLSLPSEGACVTAYATADKDENRETAESQGRLVAQATSALQSVRTSGLVAGSLTIEVTYIHAQDYENAWRKDYHVIEVSERLAIVPSWEQENFINQARTGQIPLLIDPGMAFGTGTHETTLLCLGALQDLVQPDTTVLDVGTGTGILAIAAAKLGSRRILALDLDDIAITVARQNVVMNQVQDQVEIKQSDLLTAVPAGEQFTVVMANLLADLVIRLLPTVIAHLADGGVLVASGIVLGQADKVVQAMQTVGFVSIRQEVSGDWVVIRGTAK